MKEPWSSGRCPSITGVTCCVTSLVCAAHTQAGALSSLEDVDTPPAESRKGQREEPVFSPVVAISIAVRKDCLSWLGGHAAPLPRGGFLGFGGTSKAPTGYCAPRQGCDSSQRKNTFQMQFPEGCPAPLGCFTCGHTWTPQTAAVGLSQASHAGSTQTSADAHPRREAVILEGSCGPGIHPMAESS